MQDDFPELVMTAETFAAQHTWDGPAGRCSKR